jgi:hypothetical protein
MKTNRTFSATLLSAIFGLGCHLTVEAIQVDLVDGDWINPVTATSVAIVNSPTPGLVPSTARWGTLPTGPQSGYDFLASATPFNALTNGTPFALGTFSHINLPIPSGSAIDSIDLYLQIGNLFSFNTLIGIDHNETPNSPPPGDDIVTITNSTANLAFTYLGTPYYFNLVGFSQDGGNTFSTVYQTQENAVNTTTLYGKITESPVPDSGTTMVMLGLSLLGCGAIRRILVR